MRGARRLLLEGSNDARKRNADRVFGHSALGEVRNSEWRFFPKNSKVGFQPRLSNWAG
jgi:hypothetical protein